MAISKPVIFRPPSPKGETNQLSNKRGEWLLAFSALVGLLFAAFGLLPSLLTSEQPVEGIANINGFTIKQEEYEALKNKITEILPAGTLNKPGQEQKLLDAMIEEYLLAQHALALGLGLTDARLRKMLAASLVEWQARDSLSKKIELDTLETFFEENRSFFNPADKVQVQRLKFTCIDKYCSQEGRAFQRAKAAYMQLSQGDDVNVVKTMLADKEISTLPNLAISRKELHHLLGKTLTDVVMSQMENEISQPIMSVGSYHILVSIKRESSKGFTFKNRKDEVLKEYNKRRQLTELRDYIQQLKADSAIEINETYFHGVEKQANDTAKMAVQ